MPVPRCATRPANFQVAPPSRPATTPADNKTGRWTRARWHGNEGGRTRGRGRIRFCQVLGGQYRQIRVLIRRSVNRASFGARFTPNRPADWRRERRPRREGEREREKKEKKNIKARQRDELELRRQRCASSGTRTRSFRKITFARGENTWRVAHRASRYSRYRIALQTEHHSEMIGYWRKINA